MTIASRHHQSWFGRWFSTVDRVLIAMVLLLVACGVIAVAAASPAAAHRYSDAVTRIGDLHYLKRQIVFVLAGVPLMLGVSMLPVSWAKRLAILGTVACIAALLAVPFLGAEKNGAIRWFPVLGFAFQPSEFLKPVFIVTTAWLLSVRFEDRSVPVLPISFGLLAIIGVLLIRQPDVGQTALFGFVWLAQALLAGMSLWLFVGIVAAAAGGLGLAYLTIPHITSRLDRFITGEGDNFQAKHAIDGFRAGGPFGAGPGEGQMKFALPEAHTDYIFSVIGEEFGAIAAFMLALLFLAIVVRVLLALIDEEEPFVLLAAAGLIAQFGGQAAINMGVNLALLPSKGMTLPFISHGGSSFLAMSLGMGLLLALTRRNPFAKASPYVPQWRPG